MYLVRVWCVCACVSVCVWVLILLPNFVQNAAEIFLVKLSQVVRISKLTLVHSFRHMFAFQFEFQFVFYFRIPQKLNTTQRRAYATHTHMHSHIYSYVAYTKVYTYRIYKTMFFNGSPLIQFSFLAYKQKPSEPQTNTHKVENRKQKIEAKSKILTSSKNNSFIVWVFFLRFLLSIHFISSIDNLFLALEILSGFVQFQLWIMHSVCLD